MITRGEPTYEVIREHAETGRVQLVQWGLSERQANFQVLVHAADRDGVTLATSGKLERGWVARVRRA